MNLKPQTRELLLKGLVIILIGLFAGTACGVKGDPQPPLTPAELGHGRPTYKRATRPLAFPTVPPVEPEENDEDDEDEDD